ncbi:MAG: DUF192 domain-containing protein [Bdellovibrionales bacterium]|nr:DUF192 domain-containing protein [Bdellovibrionales bacterium]
MITIYQKPLNLIKNLALIMSVMMVFSLEAASKKEMPKVSYQLSSPKSEKVNLRLAITRQEHAQGLSGIKPGDFPNDAGMLFVNDEMGIRQFWMPDTYFNLDMIFLDQDLKIVFIEKNAPAHPGTIEPPVIFRGKPQRAQFILETKANSKFSKDLKIGDQLKWIGPISLSEIALKTRQQQ